MVAQGSPKRGTAGSRVHSVFRNRLRELKLQASLTHNAFRGKIQRRWQTPGDLSGSLLDVSQLHEPSFNRDKINSEYAELTKDTDSVGTTGDIIALKLQLDYNAAEERAFRARHMTICRAFAMGHGRRIGQGQGNVWDPKVGIEALVASYIARGGVKGAS